MLQSEAFNLFRQVRDELEAVRFCVDHILEVEKDNRAIHQAVADLGINHTAFRRCGENLETTYILRLFSEFESILRNFWRQGLKKNTHPEMKTLMDSIARRRRMNESDLLTAHRIREYRNDVIHQNPRLGQFDFVECRRQLGKFVRWLPPRW